jgi:hypothetical protein
MFSHIRKYMHLRVLILYLHAYVGNHCVGGFPSADDWAFRSDGNQVNQSLFYFISSFVSGYMYHV